MAITDTPKATFLMTAYNSAGYIKESIQSVLNQKSKDFIFIIIDDSSTDATPEIISSFKDSRIKLICNKENKHIAEAANAGLREVETDYVLRIDSDDICMTGRLGTQLAFMERHKGIDVCGSYIRFFGNKNGVWKMPLTDAAIKARLIWDNAIANSSVIIRMETLRIHGLEYTSNFQYPPFEDYELWVKMIPFAGFANLNRILVQKREHIVSQSEIHQAKTIAQYKNFDRWMFGYFNLELSETELNLFMIDKLPEIKPDAKLFEEYKALNIKLLSHFTETGFFDKKELEKVIERRWRLLLKQIKT